MATPAVEIAIPSVTVSAAFTNGERAVTPGETPNTTYMAKWITLKGGIYTLKLWGAEIVTAHIGAEGISARRLAVATNSLVTADFYTHGGVQRLDVSVVGITTQLPYFVLSLWQGGKLVYASNAQGWVYSSSQMSDNLVPLPSDERLTLPVWTVLPNWANGVLERLAWNTQILPSETDHEQRRSLRRFPRRSVEASFLRTGPAKQRIDTFLSGIGKQRMLVPLWFEQLRLPAGAEAVPEPTASFQVIGGDYTYLYDPYWSYTYEPMTMVNGKIYWLAAIWDGSRQSHLIVQSTSVTSDGHSTANMQLSTEVPFFDAYAMEACGSIIYGNSTTGIMAWNTVTNAVTSTLSSGIVGVKSSADGSVWRRNHLSESPTYTRRWELVDPGTSGLTAGIGFTRNGAYPYAWCPVGPNIAQAHFSGPNPAVTKFAASSDQTVVLTTTETAITALLHQPSRNSIWAWCTFSQKLFEIDAATLAISATYDLSSTMASRWSLAPAIDHARGLIWFVVESATSTDVTVYRFDTTSGTITGTFPVPASLNTAGIGFYEQWAPLIDSTGKLFFTLVRPYGEGDAYLDYARIVVSMSV